jgi:hypothetical protein
LSQKYANNAEDVEVVAGEYSAKHWFIKAQEIVLADSIDYGSL